MLSPGRQPHWLRWPAILLAFCLMLAMVQIPLALRLTRGAVDRPPAVAIWLQRGQALAYGWVRAYNRRTVLRERAGWTGLQGEHVSVHVPEALVQDAALVLETAERVYPQVVAAFGYQPPQPVPILVQPTPESLQAALGWASLVPTAGVYWGGVIWVPAPSAWLRQEGDALQRSYQALHPLAHELAHYFLDYQTNGNYPRWFSEGLAQRVEYEMTGFRLPAPAGNCCTAYGLAALEERFDGLPDQAQAYREALALVEAIAGHCGGSQGLQRLTGNLAGGLPFWPALQRACGLGPGDLEQEGASPT